MNRKKLIYFTDLLLVPLFLLTFFTGIGLHVAGHNVNHQVWHNWAVFHTIAGLLFTMLGFLHVKTHWAWYKALKNGKGISKKRIVLLFSLVFLLSVITGMLLLCVEGPHSFIGLFHYKTGVLLGVLGILHVWRRIRFFYNGFAVNVINHKEDMSVK